jgi:hypothetical protein
MMAMHLCGVTKNLRIGCGFNVVPMWHPLRLAEDTSAPIGRITSFSAKFTDAPLAEGKFETYLHERESAKKPRAVRLSRPQLPMINCSAARRA